MSNQIVTNFSASWFLRMAAKSFIPDYALLRMYDMLPCGCPIDDEYSEDRFDHEILAEMYITDEMTGLDDSDINRLLMAHIIEFGPDWETINRAFVVAMSDWCDMVHDPNDPMTLQDHIDKIHDQVLESYK